MDKIVMITGVCGGIGYATAKIFKRNGWKIIGIDRAVKSDADNILDLYIEKDISEPENIGYIYEQIKAHHYEHINCLVNNAAVQVPKSILDTTEDEWDLVHKSNIKSVFISVKYAFPLLKKVRGSIVNVSSVHAFVTSKNISSYASSKGALLAFTRSMALEFGEYGIRANCVVPGATDTPMLVDGLVRTFGSDMAKIDEGKKKIASRHPLGRIGDPEDMGNLIYFLADNELSKFITGQSLVADGGALAQLSTEV